MVLERLSKKGAAVAGSGAGGFAGGFFNNPGIILLGAVVIGFIFFAGDIRKAFGGFGEAVSNLGSLEFPSFELPEINFPQITFPDFPEFPEITFPEFPDFTSIFDQIFNLLGGGNGPPSVPTPPPPGVSESDLGPITTPEGCTVDSQGIIRCPTPPTFDVCVSFPELCEQPEQEFDETMDEIETPFMPPVVLPPDFEPGGPSFEGGTIFETPDCFLTLNQITQKYNISASAAANRKAISCSTMEGDQPTDFPSDFDFEAEPTPESEARRAACTTCELFGLNCGICSGAEFP